MNKDFNEWMLKFKTSISDYGYYVDFQKVYKNVNTIRVELNILNSLIGSKNIKVDFIDLVSKYPETLKCIPILLAVRQNEINAMDSDGEFNYSFIKPNQSAGQYCIFMEKTGLFDLITNKRISNLVDYAIGVETGLDSNGRKNRGGHIMENIVENFIVNSGFKKGIDYFKEINIREIQDKWGIDLSELSNQGKMEKRFDFVVKTLENIYLIETNFYQSSGSKLNETARSYKDIARTIEKIEGVTFVWFTDGKGWFNARKNLEETFHVMDHIYNIEEMEDGIMSKLFI